MANSSIPKEMGFAEFASQLVREAAASIVESLAEQEQRLAEIAESAALSIDDFADRVILNEDVDLEMARLFPGALSNQRSSVFDGAPYVPPNPGPEDPPIQEVLGIALGANDVVPGRRGPAAQLTAAGVARVRDEIRRQLAEARQVAFRSMLAHGVPRVLVDSGRINAKVTFEAIHVDEALQPPRAVRLVGPIRPLRLFVKRPSHAALQNVRVVVRQADDRAPQTSRPISQVSGEIEITFKTVV